MISFVRIAAVAAILIGMSASSDAATVTVDGVDYNVESPFQTVANSDVALGLGFIFVAAPGVTSPDTLALAGGLGPADPTNFAAPTFNTTFSLGSDAFNGNGRGVQGDANAIEIVFEAISPPSGAAESLILATITFDTALSGDPFAIGSAFPPTFAPASVTFANLTPVPLPAGGLLLIAGLGLMLGRQRLA